MYTLFKNLSSVEYSDQGKYLESTGQLLEECGRLAAAAGFAAVAFDRIAVLAIVDEVAAHVEMVLKSCFDEADLWEKRNRQNKFWKGNN